VYVSNFNNWSDAHVLVRPEVTSMEQLRSGRFAVPGLGGGYAHMLRAFVFPKYGLDKGPKQPTILSAGDTPSALGGVVSRQYDAALASYENYMAFRKRGAQGLGGAGRYQCAVVHRSNNPRKKSKRAPPPDDPVHQGANRGH